MDLMDKIEALRNAAARLVIAADDVGSAYFDTDNAPADVDELREATAVMRETINTTQ